MLKKIKMPIGLFFINNIFFLLSIFTLKVKAETKIVAKSGDTLFKISQQYQVPLKELMYKKLIENLFNIAKKNNKIKYSNVNFVLNKEAELIKLFRNCFLATKVSFCNEICSQPNKRN